MNALLAIDRLALRLGEFALGPLDLSLAPGDYLVLLGPSGCGKTSLLRAIAGLYATEAGTISLDGADLTGRPPQKRRMGYVAQGADLFPHMSVAGNIAFGLAYQNLTRQQRAERLRRITDLLSLSPLLDRRPVTLSGGESKRVALARSLVIEPRVLLLDEPLSMLDPNARAAMIEALKAIHGKLGTATIHVTHDREEAWTLGERCAVMRAGRIEQVGPVRRLFREPHSRFVAEFLGGANVFPARFEERDGRWLALLGWAELQLAGPVPFASGCVQIRPESLTLQRSEGADVIEGTVLSAADRGIYAELAVEVPRAGVLRVHVLSGDAARASAGGPVRLYVAAPPHPIEETDSE